MKHHFYIIQLNDYQNFTGIIGFDIISKFNIKLYPAENYCQIKENKVNFIKPGDLPIDIENSMDKINNIDTKYNSVHLVKKVNIDPHESKYVKVYVNNLNIPHDKPFVFSPNLKHNLTSFECISSNLHDKSRIISFYVYIENSSSETTMLNKGMYIGNIFEILELNDTKDSNLDNSTINSETLNIIQPSDEILKARENEFDLNDFNLNHLSDTQRSKLHKLLLKHKTVFSKSLKTLGHTDRVIPEIKFSSNYPIKTLPFPIPQALQEEAKTQINELIDAGIIEKNLSSWSCPMLLVKKKTPPGEKQKFRLAVDLRLLNSIIENSTYPLPKITDIISKLSKYTYFTTLDMPSAYHQINLPEQYRDRLSFITPWATYKYNRLLFGLKNAASIFQSLMDSLVEECNIDGIFDYQDDLVIGANSFNEMLEKLDVIFNVFAKNNLTFSAKKSSFFNSCINYLGFQIDKNCVSPISSNISKIVSFPKPKTKKQLKSFLGTCGFYRSLIPGYAHLTSPLVKLTSPKIDFIWTECHDKAFQKLQEFFFKKPFVIQPDFSKEFFLNTDASKTAISAILLQKQGDKLLPISFFSRALKDSESRYPAIKLELFAIYKGINAFKYYLYGRKFKILSDSKPLAHYKKISSPSDITTRWLLDLSQYDYEFIHLPGKDNLLADLFSRTIFEKDNIHDLNSHPELVDSNEILPINTDECINQISNENTQLNSKKNISQKILDNLNKLNITDPLLEISNQTILKTQLQDKHLRKIYDDIIINNKHYSSSHKYYLICPDTQLLLYAKDPSNANSVNLKIALPLPLRAKALRIAHVSHLGISKTFQNISKSYFWPGIFADTSNFVRSCEQCNAVKKHRIPMAPFQNVQIPKFPGEFISMDILGPLSNGWYILTIIDHFSRHLSLYTLRKITAENVVSALFQYITVFGRPSMVLTDLGSQFTSHIFSQFNKTYGILLRHTALANPMANSISERVNTSIKATIEALLLDGVNFHNAVRIHQMLYNNSIHRTTKYSPNFIHFGRELSDLYHTYIPNSNPIFFDKNHTFFQMLKDLDIIYQKVYDNLTFAQKLQNEKQKQNKLRKFKIGDNVYVKNTSKFKIQYTGPYVVTKIISPVIVSIQRFNHPHTKIPSIHINRLWLAPKRKQELQNNNNESSPNLIMDLPQNESQNVDNNNSIDNPSCNKELQTNSQNPINVEIQTSENDTNDNDLNKSSSSNLFDSDISNVSLFDLVKDIKTPSSSFSDISSNNTSVMSDSEYTPKKSSVKNSKNVCYQSTPNIYNTSDSPILTGLFNKRTFKYKRKKDGRTGKMY